MRIGIDASQANAAMRTGTERYAFEILHGLARIRGDETYALYLESPLRADLQDLGSGFQERILHWPLRRFWHQGRLSIEMLRDAPEVFFAPAHAMPLIHPKRSVTMIHDVGFMDLPGLYPRAERMYHQYAAKHALRTAKKILVPSHFTKERIQAHFSVSEDAIVVIPHGFRPEQKTPPSPNDLERVQKQLHIDGKPYFLYVGRLEQKKNIVNLLRAFAHARAQGLTDHVLVLAGTLGFGSDEIARVIAQEQLADAVRLPGYTPWADVVALCAGAELFTFISNYEGFGFPVLEAFATRTPVMVSRAGSLPEIAGDAAYYVDGKDIESIARGMCTIHNDVPLRQSLVRRGAMRCTEFSWDRAAKMTRDVLLSV